MAHCVTQQRAGAMSADAFVAELTRRRAQPRGSHSSGRSEFVRGIVCVGGVVGGIV